MISLVIAIGNSSGVVAVMRDDFPLATTRFATTEPPGDEEVERILATYHREHPIEGSVMCSVVPSLGARMNILHDRCFSKPLVVVDPRRPLWFRSQYESMATLGADRWCAVIAAREEYGFPAVVIDCGTAMTINVIDPEGDFAGGNILPGISTQFRTLHSNTAQLPYAQTDAVPQLIGKHTSEAIQAGILWTVSYGVEGLIRACEEQYRQSVAVIVTGGDAGLFRPHPERRVITDSILVLKGAARYLASLFS